jgi:hypothetical protein
VTARLAAIAAALALAGCARGCPGSDASGRGGTRQDGEGRPSAAESLAPREPGHPSTFASRRDLPGARPLWHVTLPGAPAVTALEHVTGPVVVSGVASDSGPGTGPGDALVLVTSSAAGVVAIAVDTGEVRWQRASEQAPGLPITGGGDGDEVWLPGRCAHRMHEAQPLFAPGASNERGSDEQVLGCVDIVDRAGSAREQVWIRVDQNALDAGAPGHSSALGRSGALGRRGRNLIWVHAHDLFEISMPAGRVVAHRRVSISDTEDGTGFVGIAGWIDVGPDLIVASTTGLAGFAACPVQVVCLPAWHLRWPRAVGVTGPIRAGANVAWVRDQILEAGNGGRIVWSASDFHAYAPGSLALADDGLLLVLRLSNEGIQPVRIEPARGRTVENGVAVPGAQVLAAAPWGSGLVAVVRLDASLRHDVVIAWDEHLNPRWAWPVPEPARPRVEPVGLAALPASAGGGVVVFHDGRFLARLPPPGL